LPRYTAEYFKGIEYGLGLQFKIEFIIIFGRVRNKKIYLYVCTDFKDIHIYIKSLVLRFSSPEVGKLKIVYLRHLPLPTTQQVAETAYLLKKGRIGRLELFTLDFGKVGVEGTMFFTLKRSLEIVIDNDQQRSQ
jgi:hypothetical protein